MRRSRRYVLVASAALAVAGVSRAQTSQDYMPILKDIMARTWKGRGSAPNEYIAGGYFIIELAYHFTFNDDMAVTGTHETVISLDNSLYRANFSFNGSVVVDGDNFSVQIADISQMSGDDLPENYYWQGLQGSLRILKYAAHPGSYVMAGSLTSQRGPETYDVKITDYDA